MIYFFKEPKNAEMLAEKGSIFGEFKSYDLEILASGLEARIAKNKAKIKTIENSPRNEGQSKYQIKVDSLERENSYIFNLIEKMKYQLNNK